MSVYETLNKHSRRHQTAREHIIWDDFKVLLMCQASQTNFSMLNISTKLSIRLHKIYQAVPF